MIYFEQLSLVMVLHGKQTSKVSDLHWKNVNQTLQKLVTLNGKTNVLTFDLKID